MEPDTIEKIQRDLDAINARVVAFEQAQKQADVEPPTVTEDELVDWEGCTPSTKWHRAAAEIRHLRAELARLREGLKVQPEDFDSRIIRGLADNNGIALASSPREVVQCLAREIQRHRALVTK